MPKKHKKAINIDDLPLNERILERERQIESQLAAMSSRSRDIAPVHVGMSADLVDTTESKSSRTAAVVSTWQVPPSPVGNYERVAKEGYGGNELVFSAIDQLCKSASEPTICAYRGPNRVDDHPILDLLRKPNPYLTGYDYIGSLIMFRSIAGNAYTEIVYNIRGDTPVELYLIRPDRMTILPNSVTGVGGYRFKLGTFQYDYPPEEIGHYKIKNPLDTRYGMPPMSVLLNRTDTDNFAREFTKAFFFNAGVPSTLLAFKALLDEQDREMIRNRFGQNYNGAGGWHNVMVTEQNEVDVKQLGMPMGARGIAYPELDEINEARISMVFGVPLSIMGARLGQRAGSYANKVADIQSFWNQTLVPIYREIEANFNQWLVPHFPDIDRVAFDLTTVFAFNDETDVLHARTRNNLTQSLIAWRESRRLIGLETDPDDDDIILVPQNMVAMKVKDFLNPFPPVDPIALAQQNNANNSTNGDQSNENGHNPKPFVRDVSRNGNGNGTGAH